MATVLPLSTQYKMSEPHQRTQSGKLRRGNAYKEPGSSRQEPYQHKHILIGVENAGSVEDIDPDDEVQLYHQAPTTLSDTQVSLLSHVTKGLGITDAQCIDREWRKTWNIGAWCIGKCISISANIIQPNVAGVWANIKGTDLRTVESICNGYKSYGLENSAATAKASSNLVELKGRWVPHVIDSLYSIDAVKPEQVDITYANITQSRLFFWVLVGNDSEYLCTPSQDTLNLLSRYVPNWAFDVTETNAGGGLSIKLSGKRQLEIAKREHKKEKLTATQISINSVGWVQFTGSEYCIEDLYSALATAVRSLIQSVHLTTFMESLEYRTPKDTEIM